LTVGTRTDDDSYLELQKLAVETAVLWRFSKPYLWDYRVGKIPNAKTPLAKAVAASSAFPPFISPVFFYPSP